MKSIDTCSNKYPLQILFFLSISIGACWSHFMKPHSELNLIILIKPYHCSVLCSSAVSQNTAVAIVLSLHTLLLQVPWGMLAEARQGRTQQTVWPGFKPPTLKSWNNHSSSLATVAPSLNTDFITKIAEKNAIRYTFKTLQPYLI